MNQIHYFCKLKIQYFKYNNLVFYSIKDFQKYKLVHLFIFFILIFLNSCNITKYIEENEYLLSKVKIKIHNNDLDKDELKNYLRQKPNRRILGLKMPLGMYSLSKKGKDNWINNFLRKNGEPPIIFKEHLTRQSKEQLSLYLINKGYRNSQVTDTVKIKGQKATVVYNIKPNQPYTISNIKYQIEAPHLKSLILNDTSNSLIQQGIMFNLNLLDRERMRITNHLKTKGYYDFSKDYISFIADTNAREKKASVTIKVEKHKEKKADTTITTVHPKYKIRNIYVVTDYNKQTIMKNRDLLYSTMDTVNYGNIHFSYHNESKVKPKMLTQSIYIKKGDFYDSEDVQETHSHLSSLRIINIVNIEFEKIPDSTLTHLRELNCFIRLTPTKSQSYTVEVEGTNSSGDIGFGGNFTYQHKNLFRSAEIFDLSIKGGIEFIKKRSISNLDNTTEFGSEARLRIPRFLLPLKGENFVKKHNPLTSLSISYNYQKRPDYTRRISNVSYGYRWKGNKHLTHLINPLELNLVKLLESTSQFRKQINRNPYLKESYEEHTIAVTNYSVIYNNQSMNRSKDFIFVRYNVEPAGNILTGVYHLFNVSKQSGAYHLFGNPYSQYIKSNIDFRYYQILNESDKLVYRFFAGAGYPYNNSMAMPFEKKYFSGGANSIRAWQVRSLGPGSYQEEVFYPFPNNLGDIKLEANLEYRFDLFWVIEGALFLDMGNIWAINRSDERKGALFKFNDFYKDIAIGSGIGTRFDFSFFIFRIDFGLKTRYPENKAKRWIFNRKKIGTNDYNINIGIGYPF